MDNITKLPFRDFFLPRQLASRLSLGENGGELLVEYMNAHKEDFSYTILDNKGLKGRPQRLIMYQDALKLEKIYINGKLRKRTDTGMYSKLSKVNNISNNNVNVDDALSGFIVRKPVLNGEFELICGE